jgi:cell division transport system permease protein
MKHALSYAFEEAIASLWRGRSSGLLSTSTIGLALFVLGGFLLATANLQRLGDEWSRSAEMSVYLHDDATPAQRTAIEGLLTPGPLIAGTEFVSKAEALDRFKQTFSDLSSTVGTLESNPLPASYEVRLQPQAGTSSGVDELAQRLRTTAGVADVRYDRQWLERLTSTIGIVRFVGLALAGVLSVAAALTVATVVRLALHARRDEIEIMQLVGAPQAYIRGPFVVEGILQGGIGAIVALVLLSVTYLVLRDRYLVPLAAAINLSSVRFLSIGLWFLLFVGGMLVGCLGGFVASRRT